MSIYAKLNTVQPIIAAVIDTNGNYITGLSITYEVRKSTDHSLVTSGTLSNVGNIYIDNVTITSLGNYYVLYTSPSGYENGQEELIVESATLTDINSQLSLMAISITKVLGLSQSNYRLKNQIYDSNGCLTSATIRIYPTATDTQNDTNPIAQYGVNALYDGNDHLIDYQVVEA